MLIIPRIIPFHTVLPCIIPQFDVQSLDLLLVLSFYPSPAATHHLCKLHSTLQRGTGDSRHGAISLHNHLEKRQVGRPPVNSELSSLINTVRALPPQSSIGVPILSQRLGCAANPSEDCAFSFLDDRHFSR